MSTQYFKRVWLSEVDLVVLAKMPITYGSVPSGFTERQWKSWHKLVQKRLIVGCPGDWCVRWAVLTKGQYRKVELYRRGF